MPNYGPSSDMTELLTRAADSRDDDAALIAPGIAQRDAQRDADERPDPAPAPRPTDEEVAEFADAIPSPQYGQQGGQVVSQGRPAPRGGGVPDNFTVRMRVEQLTTRPEAHELAAPAKLAKAWKLVLDAAEAARVAFAQVYDVDRERSNAEAGYLDAVREAARTGVAPPERPAPRDWEATKAARAAHASGLLQRATGVRAEYDALAVRELAGEARVESLQSELSKAHAEALEALSTATEAAQRVGTVREALINAAREGDSNLEQRPGTHFDTYAVKAGLQAARAQLERLNPERDSFLVDLSQTRCDMQTRLALAGSGEVRDRYSIWRLEVSEQFKLTSLTRGWPPMERVPGALNYQADATSERY